MDRKINLLYFSGTGTTKRIVNEIGCKLAERYGNVTINEINFTLPGIREQKIYFLKHDIVIVGVPVYAGRVPNVLLKYLNSIAGNGALAVAVVVYGNRNYDDALVELNHILEADGFKVIAGAAFIGEHSFSYKLAKDRPDEKDMEIARLFSNQIYEKLAIQSNMQIISLKGNIPYQKYYIPKDKNGIPQDIRKVHPKTNDNCIDCKLCAENCPMGSIDYDDVSKLNGICIKCNSCVKKCPSNAKYFNDIRYLNHKIELEIEFAERREPELFV